MWLSLVLPVLAACQDDRPAAAPSALVPPPAAMLPGRLVLPGIPILVVPATGLDPAQNRRLAALVADRLADEDILASARSTASQSYILSAAIAGDQVEATLLRPDGLVAARFAVVVPELAAAAPDGIEAAARRLAHAVGIREGAVAVPRPARPPLRLTTVTGAPGDGAAALARALVGALALRGVTLAPDDPAALGITLAVALAEPIGGVQRVTLTWAVTAPDGAVLGQVAQANDVPAGRLDGAWGPIADAAASGGADGLAALLDALEPVP